MLHCGPSCTLGFEETEHLESTKPEDKIFALLGLAADRKELERFGVVPNYDVSYEQTYATTMAALLRQGHISLLSMCQASRSPDLPSWVPDWSQSVTDMLQDIRDDHVTPYPEFNCSGHRTRQDSIRIYKDDGAIKCISMKACLYDNIYEVGRFPSRTNSKRVTAFADLLMAGRMATRDFAPKAIAEGKTTRDFAIDYATADELQLGTLDSTKMESLVASETFDSLMLLSFYETDSI